ncbi:MAG: CvpA family protein [Thermoguttaceae bacterium]|jgi:membrane protein required for colicin V production
MNSVIPYDIVMLVVLLGAAVFGAWKGMVWQLASLASLLVSAAVAIHFSTPLAPYFSATEPWNRFLAMLVLYILTSLAIWLLFRMVSGIVNRVKLREFDRQMGALFGLAKGVLFCVVITFFAVTLSEPARQIVLKSYSGYAIACLTRNANPILPEDVRAVIGKYIDELDQKLDPNTQPSQGENKNIGQEDLKTNGQVVEQRLQQAGQKIEDLGRQTGQKLESLGGRAKEAIDP